ncbi:lysosomal-trafficking regulator-like [Sinocyclocheilus anshuiensis]|uniref:lysosomal-trafficking regulator-like n=1 Tax=Sinocyclocheilus anshuiensis TaxID=1608454 RepID=UPI0007BA1A3B|nr:PREDICTED: lysosomal-trafficking regulator-like [Sinocyclocheilus anshuiensis]
MASSHLADLSQAWENYMDCRAQGADLQISLQCLESFLCTFHCVRQLSDPRAKDALKFCSDMSGASNTLAREFLTDVHQLCSAVAQRAEDEEESHMVALGEYLVRGRGFLLLSTLDFVIDQELTCREELLTLLLSLLPLVWKIPVQEEKAPDFTLPSLLEVFLCQEGRTIPQKAGQDRCDVENSGKHLSGSWKSRRSRRTAQRYSVRDARKSQLSTSDSEANSDDKTTNTVSKHRRFHSSAVRVSCQLHQSNNPSQPASQHPTLDAMSTIEPSQPHRLFGSHTLDPNMLTDPTTLSIFNRMENSPFDLCHVLLSLLEKVCKFDMTINHNPGLAVSVVPTLTEIFTEFGDCCGPGGGGGGGIDELAGGWTEEPIALVQRMLLRTILHLMFVDVGQNETLPDNLRRSLMDLFRATLKIRTCLERQADPFAPRPKKTLQEIQEDFSFSRYRHRALLLPELLEGVLQLLLGCLQASAPNPFFFSQSLELVHEFVQHRGLELFEATALRLEALAEARDSEVGSEASERLRCLIADVFKIISAVKRAKSEQLHQSVCARRRHRHCEYSHFLHHHRDLSGLPVSTFKQAARRNPFEEDSEGHDGEVRYPERCCCLAACAHQCLRLFQRLSPSGPAVLQVLAGVQAVGICCCMDPRSVIGPMLQAFQAPGLRSYQSHVLSVLSRLVLEQLGGGQPSEKAKLASCNICTLDNSQLPGLEETLQGYGPKKESNLSTSQSPSYRSQGILPSGGAEDMLWKWDALEAYQEIVFGEDWHLSQQIAGHVCQLTLRGNAVVQWQLYTHIFNPVLQRGVELTHHAQQLGVSTTCSQVCSYHTHCPPVEVLLVYLQTLPALLKSSQVVRDLFLSCNGLKQITELIYLDCTRPWALKVFETLILNAWHHHMDSAVHELERAEAQEREAVLGLVEELSSRGACDGPQSLTKFYEGLKEACPHPKGKSAFSAVGRNRGEAHLNTINLFLCVAFLCVSKEADSDRDSANDSEDTSGYDSTASEPLGGRLPCLSPDSVALPSKEQIRRAADVWSVCRWVYMASPVFQRQFFRLGGLDVCLRLMTMVIQKLTSKIKDSKFKKKRESKGKSSPSHVDSPTQGLTGHFDNKATAAGTEETHQHDTVSPSQVESKSSDPTHRLEEEWPLQSIRLLEALLAICLHSANSALQRFEPDLSFQLQSVEETLCEVRDQLSRSGVVNSELAVPLFDSLLHVALAEMFCSPDVIKEKPDKKSQVSGEVAPPAGDLSEEVDEAQVSGTPPLGEEEGYDADSESNPEDSIRQEEGIKVEAVVSLGECTLGMAGVPQGSGRGRLLFPEICLMELQLLASSSPDLEVLGHVLQSLLGAVKGHHNNAKLLYQQGGVKAILTGFQNILSQSDASYKECQTILTELLVAMVSDRITAEELALLTRLFLEKTPPTEILLRGLLQIVEANADTEPLYFMSFPMIPGAGVPGLSSSPGMRPHGTAGGKGGVNTLLRGKLPLGCGEADMSRPGHLRSSPWHTAPFHLPLVGQNCWPHMASGFSASLWVRAGKDEDGRYKKEEEASLSEEVLHGPAHVTEQQTDRCLLHVLSMGSKALMLQVWVNISTGAFTFRICIDPNDEMKAGLLAQAESGDGVLTTGMWQHLALTYTQQPEGRKNVHGQLTLWVSGIRKCDVSLDFTLPRKSSLSSDSNKTYCMLGHYQHSSEEQASPSARWDMGTLLLFNGSRIDTAEAFYLFASGPDLTSIMPCKYGKPHGTVSKYVTQEGLQCEQIRELLMRNTDIDIAPLIESLAVVYAPSMPSLYTIYEPVIRLKGQAKSTVASQRPFSAKEVQSSILEPPFLRTMMPCQALGLHSVLHKIGGTGAFVFLFARAVELSDCEKTQSLALQLLLSLVKTNQHRTHEMQCYHGYSMIHQVLIKPKCIVGYHVLKTLLDGCCSGSILTIGEDGQFHLDAESTVVLQDLRLLSEILLDWKIWAKAQCGVWETLLTALEILIRVHHPQQMFNIRQLLKAQVVHRFLLACQVLQEHRDEYLTSIPQEVCLSFVKIIQEVLGSPPDLDLLRLVYNFLLAVHPPTNTYVCHTPTSFYFSLHIDGKLYQEKVQSMMYLRHSSSGGKSACSSVLSLSPTVFTETPAEVRHASSPEHGDEDLSLRPPSMGPSPHSSPALMPRLAHGSVTGTAEPEEGTSLSTQQDLGSTETLKRGGDELLSSCESAKTICDSQNVGGDEEGSVAGNQTPFINVEEEHDSSPPDSEDHFDWTSEEVPRRPDSLKGIQSFQRSHSNLASLGLAFPAQNGSLTIARWPTVADRAAPPDDWESYTYSPGYDRHSKADSSNDRSSAEDCLVLICCGLYDLLRGVLLLLPDLLLEEVMDKLIQPEALLVLVNHSSPLIQQGVMKLLDAYFSRAQKEQKEKFLKNHGFSLLANQLYLHQGSQGLLECFLEMLFGRPVGFEEDLDLEDMENISPFRKRCIIPVLGLLENSLYENSLVHNGLCLLLQLLNACPKLADILLDHGLLYVLFNTLSTLNGLENGIPPNDYKLVVCDIQQLLVAITIHSCSSSGSQYFRIIEDLITLLGYMQTSKVRRTQEMATALQFRVIQAAIDFIKTTANQDPQKSSSYVHVPTSPHHALQQKRKSIAGRRRFTVAQSDSLLTRMRSVASDELNQMMQRRMSQENPIRASETELVQRLQRLLVLAVNRLIYQDIKHDFFDFLNFPESPDHSMSVPLLGEQTTEENGSRPSTPIPPRNMKSFRKDILKIMMEGIKIGLGSTGRGGAPRQQWKRILWSCRDTFRVQIGRMLVHTLSPAVPLEDRKEALEFVHEQSYSEILRESLSPGLEHGPKLALYLYELLHDHKDALSKEEQASANTFMTALKLCGHRCIPPSAPAKPDLLKAIKEEQLKYESEARTSKGAWEKKLANTQRSLLQRLDGKSKDISKIAADVTQNVSLRQGMERKKVMQHIRGLYKTDLSASRHWQELVQQLTHDRAVWYDQSSYPTSWQLDPTEGPNRERRRLQRCYLTIPNKYLLKDRHKLDDAIKAPLAFLFEDKTHSSSTIVKDKATSEPIRFTRKCVSVAPSRETAGELLLGKSGMYFVEDNVAETLDNQSPHGETEPASFSWTYEEIKEVHKRWWQLRDNAMEIFLTNGRTLLLAFDTSKFRDNVYHNILSSELPNLLEYGNISALTHLWSSGQITNFEYLTHLNKHAVPITNSPAYYPVFPFILRDYTSETLDLQDTSIYRNPYLEEEYKKGKREDDPMPPVQPYHYGSHYSNSGTVLHFLVRLPPFTKMFLAYQDQSFDIPDRTFHSMNTTWRLSSYESMTDVKELIPEFFYLPEFLVNREGFDFGVRQNSERVNHVNLPPWARNDPRLFILIHRQALESDQVSQMLCQWIDLVFGLKQKGKAAVQAINVFHPATYFGMDVSAVEDPVQRRALETMIKTYGQTPRQLFNASHISRAGTKLLSEAELPAAMGLLVQLAFRESREQPKDTVYPSPLPWIKGLKWGEYVGSPSAPDPVVCFSQPHGEHFGSLLALPTRAICGLSRKFCLMMIYSKEQGVRSMHSTDIQWSAILSWGYTDNMLRLKSKQSEPPINFIQCSPLHQVTSCAWVPDSCQLFTGSKCGVITAYSNRFTTTMPTEMEVETQVHLYGHTAEVTGLFVCKPYSILISVSRDGTCILWDLNRSVLLRSLSRYVTFPKSNRPIRSLTFSCDGHHLYTANSEGTVIAWCRRDQQRMKLPMFYSFLSSYAAG